MIWTKETWRGKQVCSINVTWLQSRLRELEKKAARREGDSSSSTVWLQKCRTGRTEAQKEDELVGWRKGEQIFAGSQTRHIDFRWKIDRSAKAEHIGKILSAVGPFSYGGMDGTSELLLSSANILGYVAVNWRTSFICEFKKIVVPILRI